MMRKILQCIGHCHWLRFGIRDRIIRFMRPEPLPSEPFCVPFFSGVYPGNLNSYIDWNVYFYGAYAREELRLIGDFLKKFDTPVFLDIGANVGHHTLYAALKAQKVFAFEPYPDVACKIEKKIHTNGLSNVTLFKFGLGDENRSVPYGTPMGSNKGTGSFLKMQDEMATINLPVKVGDEVVQEYGISNINFIKIDTEGFEYHVLKGLTKTLAKDRPVVFFEWSSQHKKKMPQTCPKLFPENYRFYQFISDTVMFGLFRKSGYRLSLLKGEWPDGNLLAVPCKFTTMPASRINPPLLKNS